MHHQKAINYLAVWIFALCGCCISISADAQLTSRVDCFLPVGWEGKEAKLVINLLHKSPLIDTAIVVNRHAVFIVNITEYSPAYIWLESSSNDIYFFLDAPRIDIAVDPKSFDQPLITGSPSSELWLHQQRLIQELDQSQNKVRDDFFTTSHPTDSLLIDSLSAALVKFEPTADSLNNAHDRFLTQLILESPTAASSWYLFASNFSNLPYLSTLTLFDKLVHFRSNPSYKRISKTLSRNRIGQKATSFIWQTMAGDKTRLADQQGKLTLLDFSTSFDISHQLIHRTLKKLYPIYHPLGLEIVTISNEFGHGFDRDLFGIEKLPWPIVQSTLNALDEEANSPYERRSDNFLIDNQGTVIGRNMSAQDLDDLLKATFSKK